MALRDNQRLDQPLVLVRVGEDAARVVDEDLHHAREPLLVLLVGRVVVVALVVVLLGQLLGADVEQIALRLQRRREERGQILAVRLGLLRHRHVVQQHEQQRHKAVAVALVEAMVLQLLLLVPAELPAGQIFFTN